MNPFTLPGPEFLLFYCCLFVVILLIVQITRYRMGPTGRSPRRISDPYTIALLRGGPAAAIQLAAFTLVERKLLVPSGRRLQTVLGVVEQIRDSAEQSVLDACQSAPEGWYLLSKSSARAGFNSRQRELSELGLAPNEEVRRKQITTACVGAALMGVVGGSKMLIAINTGHNNIGFLFVLTIFATGIMVVLAQQQIWSTPRGKTVLSELRNLFAVLRNNSVAQRPDEAQFLAAVFGNKALPKRERNMMRRIFENPQQESSSGCGSSSSCSSSSSGCGGGGCGGCGS